MSSEHNTTRPRLQAAFPSYLRTIVDDMYTERAIPVAEQEQIEFAMACLMEHGQRFCVDFGVLNAIDLAMAAGYLPSLEDKP